MMEGKRRAPVTKSRTKTQQHSQSPWLAELQNSLLSWSQILLGHQLKSSRPHAIVALACIWANQQSCSRAITKSLYEKSTV